jgi:hypothetical protein
MRHPDEYFRQEFAQSAALAQMAASCEALFPEGLWPAVFNIYTEENWKQEVERLLPKQTERAATMLRLLGTHSFSWDICLGSRLDRLVNSILPLLSPQPVLAAMECYQDDALLKSGAAHWFIGYGKLEGIDREVATQLLARLATSALIHPRPHNRFLTRRVLARVASPQAILLLRSFADGKLPLPPPLPWHEAEMEICSTDARRPVEEDESLPEREHALNLLKRGATSSRASK